ncbi:MAG TPA: alpha-amylase family protein, partial [Acidimicrobiales bacterium]|nr:alpha-amylase family protein [Acidimicrobiales bacterium]
PVHPTPDRDDGYDVADFYGIDPRLGSLGDFAELVHQAANRGLRVIIDLVVNHTSIEHPWFKAACADPNSRYRDWYVWSKDEPSDRFQGMVFPGVQHETWTWHEEAGAWYYHRFYNHQPDLNMANPEVRAEVRKIMAFWLQLGVSGFRMDAAPFIIERTRANEPKSPMEFDYLREFRELLSWRRGDAVILAEANAEKEELVEYFGPTGDRLPMLFNFLLNQRQFLAMARGDANPIVAALEAAPAIPDSCQWATFLRNHDEIDLGRLSEKERADCFAAFGPDESMQLYGRGIRRRLAPMLGNDRRRIELAYSLQFTLPGTPVLRYGEEIGMGDDLSLKERDAIRTPMQWNAGANAGFSTAKKKSDLHRPVISGGDFGYETVNVEAQRCDPGSLLHWMEQMLHTLRECPEFGVGTCTPVDTGDPAVLAVHYEAPGGVMLALHNLSNRKTTVDLGEQPGQEGDPFEMFADREYEAVGPALKGIDLAGYGYRWIRLRETPGR